MLMLRKKRRMKILGIKRTKQGPPWKKAVQGAREDRRGPSLHTKAEQTERAGMQAERVKA